MSYLIFCLEKNRSDWNTRKLELKIHNESVVYYVRHYTNVMRKHEKKRWFVFVGGLVLAKNRYEERVLE